MAQATLAERPPPGSPWVLAYLGGALSAVRAQCNYLGVWPYPPPPCISYAFVQATVGVGTVIIVYVILIAYEM